MIQSAISQSRRNFSLILVCAMLGACASTQKSSTGSGDQAAAPISEAAKPQDAARSGTPDASPADAAGGTAQSNAAGPAGAAGANAGAKQGASEGTAASSDGDEAAQLKRQLAEQDAQINKLRAEQQAEAAREEAEAAKMREQQAAAGSARDQQSASPAAAPAAGGKPQDEAAVFPDARSAESAGTQGGESAVQRTTERSVYFGYDQATVADEYDEMLVANAAYLKAHPALKAEVQGNCDERGSREYNLALGARRAQAVKRALELAGADGSRIAAISYGAEKPVALGKDEASYSKNRRADIVY